VSAIIACRIRLESSTNPQNISYNIRREKGLLRDPKTGVVGPNRKNIRYTELGDEMVEKLGRLGQKVSKVGSWVRYMTRSRRVPLICPFAGMVRLRPKGGQRAKTAALSRDADLDRQICQGFAQSRNQAARGGDSLPCSISTGE